MDWHVSVSADLVEYRSFSFALVDISATYMTEMWIQLAAKGMAVSLSQ